MDMFTPDFPVRVELAYARPDGLCGAIYRPQARLWLHEDLAAIVLLAARLASGRSGLSLILYDGLRTVSAQALMRESPLVRAHPHWTDSADPVLSLPGKGGHPRGMAIDIGLETPEGKRVDMGTAFDEMPEGGTGPKENRAHRLFADLPPEVKKNRALLEGAMVDAARLFDRPLWPLPVEWWDFRFPAETYNRYAPLDEADLPPQMRMTANPTPEGGIPDFPDPHFKSLHEKIAEKAYRLL